MYKPTYIDRNIIKQPWFNAMRYEHAQFLIWLWIDEMDSIGVVEPDMDGFEKFTKKIVTRKDIDIDSFVSDCNNDKKERMRVLDRGRKLWFTPTILFRNASNSGIRTLSASERDAAIIRLLSERAETRDWFVNEIIYNDRLIIKEDLINKVWNRTDATSNEKELMERVAKHTGLKISKGKNNPSEIKKRFGCMCQYSGEVCAEWELEIDHVVPVSSNHKDVNQWWNKVPCKKELNVKKGDKNVFVFLKENNLDLLPGVENAVKKWVKKGVLEYPTQYPYKRNIKESSTKPVPHLYTYEEVKSIHFNDKTPLTMQDFEVTDQINPGDNKPFWRKRAP